MPWRNEHRLGSRQLPCLQISAREWSVHRAPLISLLSPVGFQHSSFVFAHESGVTKTSVAGTKIPPGSLITHLQRALNYVQSEIVLFDVRLVVVTGITPMWTGGDPSHQRGA